MSRSLAAVVIWATLASPVLAQSVTEKPANSDSATSLETLALHLLRTGKFDEALGRYQQILQSRRSSSEAYVGMTRTYLKLGKVEEAEKTVAKGMEVAPCAAMRVAHGEVYFRQGKVFDAEKEWIAVVKGGDPDPRAYLGLARVRRAASMYRASKIMIDKAHELDSSDPDIQKFWIDTLPRTDRIKYLESYLQGENDEDDEGRTGAQRYLGILKARQKQPRLCRLETKVAATDTPLVRLLEDANHLRGYALNVMLNGHKSNLMLDTGAGGLLIDRRVVEKAGITKIADIKVGGVGDKGSSDAYVGYADSIKIGELEFRDCMVEVLDKRSVLGDDGLIGADVFEDFLVDIDFPHEKLKLTPLAQPPDASPAKIALATDHPEPSAGDEGNGESHSSTAPASLEFHDRYVAPEMKTYTPVLRFGHDLLVPTRLGDTVQKLFLLDTGAWNNAISAAAAREVTKVHDDPDIRVKGLSGSVNRVYSGDKVTLQFGHLRQENQDIVAWDLTRLSEDDGTEVSGFLGFVLLHLLDVKIDYRDGLVDFTYDAERWR